MASKGYGYSSDQASNNGGGLAFGLNQGKAKLTKFQYSNEAGQGGTQGDALEIVFSIGGRDSYYSIYPVTKVYAKGGGELTPDQEGYDEAEEEAINEQNARITHILKAFRPEEEIKAALSRPFSGFAEFAQVCQSLLPVGFDQIPLDVFVAYQWKIKGNNNRTFLEVPKTMKYGYWLNKALPGKFTAHTDEDGNLSYMNEAGEKHPFERGSWFMGSNYAHMQKEGGQAEGSAPQGTAQGGTTGGTTGQASGWS